MAADGSIRIEIKGDASELLKAFEKISKSTKSLTSAVESVTNAFMQASNAASNIDEGGMDGAAAAADRLTAELDTSAQAAGQVDDALDSVDDGGLSAAEAGAEGLDDALNDAAESADDVEDGLDRIKDAGSGLGDIFKGNLFANLATKGIEAAVSAAASLAGTVKDVASSALEAYSSYQQLTGGVETLFGTSASTVMAYADNAYKTAGMSANAYMETATSFAASLVQGLGGDTAAAAEIANTAIQDMSDNANKMGTNIQSIQDAYQGFAKQNYTMLDNLKLGYGGTQSEMVRLINDSGVLEEQISSMDGITLDTMIEAIHAVQEQLGITGTTALEAGTTIEGSVNSAKAAWENLLTGMADPDADLGTLMTNFTESLTTAAQNIIPQVVQIFQSIGPAVAGVLPTLFTAENLGGLVNAGTSIIQGIADGLIAALPTLSAQAPTIIAALIQGLATAVVAAAEVGVALIEAIIEGVGSTTEALVSAAGELVSNVLNVFSSEFSAVGGAISDSLTPGLSAINTWGSNVVSSIGTAASNAVNAVATWFTQLPGRISSALSGALTALGTWGSNMANRARTAMTTVVNNIANTLRQAISRVTTIGTQIVQGLANGIRNAASRVVSAITGVVQGAINAAKSLLGIASPSKVFAQFGEWTSEGYSIGIESGIGYAVRAVEKLSDTVTKMEKAETEKKFADEEAEYKKKLAEKYEELAKAELEERDKLKQEIAELEDDWNDKLLAREKDALEDQLDVIQDYVDDYEDAIESVRKKGDKLAEFDLFDDSEGTMHLWSLQPMIDSINAYGEAIMALKERGIADTLLDEILGMDRVDATNFANELLKMSGEAYDGYLALWKEKEDAAQRVAGAIYESEVEAINAEYAEKLPELLGESAAEAMGAFSENITEEGKEAIAAAREVSDAVLAELDRVRAAQQLMNAAVSTNSSYGGQLASNANNAAEAKTAANRANASEAAAMNAMATNGNSSREIVLNIDGKEFARATVDDIRSVEDQSPRIVSD